MAVYTKLTDEEIIKFLSHYDVGQFAAAHGIAQGIDNTNYRLEITDQGQSVRYILTVFENRLLEEELPFFVELTEWLHDHNIPCPKFIRDKHSQAFGRIHDKPAALVTFLEGINNPEIIPAHVELVGNLMARMHKIAGYFPLARHNTLSLSHLHEIFSKFRHRADEICPGLEAEMDEEFSYLRERMPHGLPTGTIHGDLFPDNVFFVGVDRPRLTGVIDFYFACQDFLMYDFAIAMNAWCCDSKRRCMPSRVKTMLYAYQKIRPISSAERRALPVLARAAAMRFLVTRAEAWLNRSEGALVKPKDPMEYVEKLRHHRKIKGYWQYGI